MAFFADTTGLMTLRKFARAITNPLRIPGWLPIWLPAGVSGRSRIICAGRTHGTTHRWPTAPP